MRSKGKSLRYYYWFLLEYIKKHARSIVLSTLISTILIISFISLSPYIVNFLLPDKQVIGIIGSFTEDNLPDEISKKISNGLLYVNEKGDFVPALASSWEIKNGGREYVVHLKNDLYWNDGSPFTSKDVIYRFKDVEVASDDPYIIRFSLKNPLAIFPNYLTYPLVKPPLTGVAGLYKVDRTKEKYNRISEVYLTPNKIGLPILIYKFYENENQLLSAYKLGEINQMNIYRKSLADTFLTWKNTSVEQTIDYSRLLTLFFNLRNNDLLKEKEVRQAIAMAIDKTKLSPMGYDALGPVPPVSWAYNPNLKQTYYDPDKARQIIRKYKTASEEAHLNLTTFYETADIAEEVKTAIAEAGIPVNVNIVSSINPEEFDSLLVYWKVPVDPDQYFFWHSTQTRGNVTGYKNVKVDKLLEDGRNLSKIADRKKVYLEFQKVIADENPALFLIYPYAYTVKRK